MENNNEAKKEIAPAQPAHPALAHNGAGAFKKSFQGGFGPKRSFQRGGPGSGRGGFQGGRGGPRKGRDGKPFMKPEHDTKILSIRRVARVTKGGKRFNFSVALVIGDKKGSVAVGTGKAGDTTSAIDKATKNGKKNLFKVKLTKTMSIPHEVSAKFSSARIDLRPAPGRGLIVGSSARNVLALAGITDVSGKLFSRTKNPLNNAQATILALKMLK